MARKCHNLFKMQIKTLFHFIIGLKLEKLIDEFTIVFKNTQLNNINTRIFT